ncbi:MAG TPA: TonB-dependent receptor plug domain-containing protein [Opitutaceae bacterium]|nr:TonB-dependent receptor plug domain-containing protein [Opitutaceae bacterium]
MSVPKFSLALCVALTCGLTIRAQVAPEAPAPAPAPTTGSNADETIVLSPFTVSTDKDRGYRATNSISGTRLNTPIKDLPMPIEVITEQFVRDTGATDLRQSLRYSSGILLQTQNDYSAPAGSFSTTPGKINNPEGVTASPDQTHMKIRGFETESVLRDGFRRQNATDSVNISRIEIARGPSSLLYGVGNFGGVVNYLVKTPDPKPGAELTFAYGSYDFLRSTIDLTGPLSSSGTVAYRLTGAVQTTRSYTDFNNENHTFISPVITWRPFAGTEVLLDVELGHQHQKGIGWQDLRAAVSGYVNDSAGYNGDFLAIPGRDVRNFRWSGPDTYRDSTTTNLEFKITQELGRNLHLLAGFDHSTFNFDQLDNLAALQTVASGSSVPAWAIAPITYAGLSSTQSGVPVGPQPSTVSYQWERHAQDNTHDQVRVELNYDLRLFQQSSRWVRINNSLLGGLSYTRETVEDRTRQTPGDVANYHSPADYSYFRFGHQGDGSADRTMVEWDNQKTTTSNPALYAVYQGKFLDDRLTLIGGVRRDRSWNKVWQYNPEFNANGTPRGDTAPSTTMATPSRDTTHQYGASLDLTPGRELAVYAMHSEGVEPNYQGKLDLYGQPLQATLAKDNEVGLKFDLFHGRISGTISRFEITRSRAQVGSSSLVWFAPVVSKNLKFNPNKDIVYNVNDLNPYNNGWNGAVVASKAQWDAAVTAGTVYQAKNSAGSTNWYANASKPTGAALLDSVFANVYAQKQFGWWGWLYGGADPGSLPFDNLVNNATMDDNGAQKSVATGTDRSRGWDTQILLQPTDNLQVLFTWSHVEKVVLNAQAWAKYPYPQDRWAIWYAPISWSATAGRPLNQVYTNPNDTSTFIAFGTGLPMDDTPKNQATAWMNYQFAKTSALHGISFGFGGEYESARIIYPAYGQNALDNNGNTITLQTPSRITLNAMVKYAFQAGRHPASVQLNVDNVANDRKRYGFIYAAPRRWQLTFDYKL